ncbi:mucin-2-like [Liolophura sinensis]|uniref:mucin-2-like n=1 Tax=Liolophura sinensis TaxID=3198878 RepID=UPI0031581529
MKSLYTLVLLTVLYRDSWTQAMPITTPDPRAGSGNNLWMENVVAGLMDMISGRNATRSQSDLTASPEPKTALELPGIEAATVRNTTYVTSSMKKNYSTSPIRKSTANTRATTATPEGKVKDVVVTNATTPALNSLNLNRILKNIFGELANQQTTTNPVASTTDDRRPAQEVSVDWRSKTLDMLNSLARGALPERSNQSSSKRREPSPNKAEPLVDGSSSLNAGVSRIITQGNTDLLPMNNAKELPVYKTGQLTTPNENTAVLNQVELFTTSTTALVSPSSTNFAQSIYTTDKMSTKATLSPFLLNLIANGLLKKSNLAKPSQESPFPYSSVTENPRNQAIDALDQTSQPETLTDATNEATTLEFRGINYPELPTSSAMSGITREAVVSVVTSATMSPKTSFTTQVSATRKSSPVKLALLPTASTTIKSLPEPSTPARTSSTTTKALMSASTSPPTMISSTTKAFRTTFSSTTTTSSTTVPSPKARKTTATKAIRTTTTGSPKTRTKPSTTWAIKSDMGTTKKKTVKPLYINDQQSEPPRVTPPSVFTTSGQTTAVEEAKFTRPTFLTPARLPKLRRPVPINHHTQFRQKVIRTEATSQQMPVTQSSISNGTAR